MLNSMVRKCGWCNVNSGLLVLRIGVGVIFIITGWMKVSDLGATAGQFASMGFAPFWAYLVSFVELIGGIAVLLGIYTRVAALLLAIIMVVASYELRATPLMMISPVSLLFSTLALVLSGGGAYSLMRKLCGCGECGACVDSGVAS